MISKKVFYFVIILLILIILGLLAVILMPGWFKTSATPTPTLTQTTSPTPFSTPTQDLQQATATFFPVAPQSTPLNALTPNPEAQNGLDKEGVIILALRDGNAVHLFAYHPLLLPLTRLTNGSWEDITPAIAPDGARVVFSSNRDGQWDIYLLDLESSQTTRLTNTPEYDASPSWSPDGQWIVYESYVAASNLEIMVRSVSDLNQAPIQLTDNPAADHSPVWSPGGREIAFVSSRSGNDEIWLARLDNLDQRFVNLSNHPSSADMHPTWSANDRYLAWSAEQDGIRNIVVWDRETPDFPPAVLGNGSWPVWNPGGSLLLSEIDNPNQVSITGYRFADGGLEYPLISLPGKLYGLDWKAGLLPKLLRSYKFPGDPQAHAAPVWQAVINVYPPPVGNRVGLTELIDLLVPYPYLSDAVDESFSAWRNRVSLEAGWDVLANLQNTFVPITHPVMPLLEEDWLATGRAIQISPLAIQAGWMVIVREDFGGQTYWRVYVKARFQDGHQGRPLTQSPWDLDARYTTSTLAFEQGGQYRPVPTGYWIDLTEIAMRYGWERLPSLNNWRSYYNGVRFNQFALREGLDWYSAMRQLYPIEALNTPTAVPTPTRTPSPTATNSFKVISTATSTPRLPSLTPVPSYTPVPTNTQQP